jgi:Ca2+-transporting ATPase
MTLALTQVVHVFSARSPLESALSRSVLRNGWLWLAVATCLVLQWLAVSLPLLQRVLHTVMPTVAEWQVIAGCALAPLMVIEVVKLVRRSMVDG